MIWTAVTTGSITGIPSSFCIAIVCSEMAEYPGMIKSTEFSSRIFLQVLMISCLVFSGSAKLSRIVQSDSESSARTSLMEETGQGFICGKEGNH